MIVKSQTEAFGFALTMVIMAILLPAWFVSHVLQCRPKEVPEVKFKVTKPELRDYFETIGKR